VSYISALPHLFDRVHSKACGRGAVTCGEWWSFFAFETPKENKMGRFGCVERLRIGEDAEDLDLILGILVDWVRLPHALAGIPLILPFK